MRVEGSGVAVVTGGGSGIGRATALALAAREAVLAELGTPTVLCCTAGVVLRAPITEATGADWEWMLAVNVTGTATTLRVFLPDVLAADPALLGDRHVAITASMSSLRVGGAPDMTLYCAAKFAVFGLARALRSEPAGTGVGVTILLPGSVRTGLIANSARGHGDEAPAEPTSAERARNGWAEPGAAARRRHGGRRTVRGHPPGPAPGRRTGDRRDPRGLPIADRGLLVGWGAHHPGASPGRTGTADSGRTRWRTTTFCAGSRSSRWRAGCSSPRPGACSRTGARTS